MKSIRSRQYQHLEGDLKFFSLRFAFDRLEEPSLFVLFFEEASIC